MIFNASRGDSETVRSIYQGFQYIYILHCNVQAMLGLKSIMTYMQEVQFQCSEYYTWRISYDIRLCIFAKDREPKYEKVSRASYSTFFFWRQSVVGICHHRR